MVAVVRSFELTHHCTPVRVAFRNVFQHILFIIDRKKLFSDLILTYYDSTINNNDTIGVYYHSILMFPALDKHMTHFNALLKHPSCIHP